MANRTIQVWGLGFGPPTCNAEVTFNNSVVFSGPIPTVDNPLDDPDNQVLLSFQLPATTGGIFPVSITITGGQSAIVQQVLANYLIVNNPIYTEEQVAILTNPDSLFAQKLAIWETLANPPLTSEDVAILETGTSAEQIAVLRDHNISTTVSSGEDGYGFIAEHQAKNNVYINGILRTLPDPLPAPYQGEWGWRFPVIDDVGIINFDLTVVAGKP
jgi:hypothetical protein